MRSSRYQIIGELDRGGMANVYLCVAGGVADFAKLHVLKCLKDEMRDDKLVAMFLDEGKLATRLNHPNVVQTFDVGLDADRYFIAMEYLEGQSLAKVLRAHERMYAQPLARDVHLRILCEAMRGLDYAHELADFDGTALNIVHRDVSPQNIFITYTGSVKVIDFGIAKAAMTVSSTEAGTMKGKASYIAPEQAIGAPIDRRADVFAMGMLLWAAAVGRPMWRTESDVQRLTEILTAKLKMPREVDPNVPLALHQIVEKALKRSPTDRFGSMSELRGAVEQYLAEHESPPGSDEREVVLGSLFAEHRLAIKAAISKHMEKVLAGARPRPLRISQAPVSSDGSDLSIESTDDLALAPSPPEPVRPFIEFPKAPPLPTRLSPASNPPPSSISQSTSSSSGGQRVPMSSETPIVVPIPDTSSQNRAGFWVGGALGLALALGASFLMHNRDAVKAAVASAPPPPSPPAVVVTAAQPAESAPEPAPAPAPAPAPTLVPAGSASASLKLAPPAPTFRFVPPAQPPVAAAAVGRKRVDPVPSPHAEESGSDREIRHTR